MCTLDLCPASVSAPATIAPASECEEGESPQMVMLYPAEGSTCQQAGAVTVGDKCQFKLCTAPGDSGTAVVNLASNLNVPNGDDEDMEFESPFCARSVVAILDGSAISSDATVTITVSNVAGNASLVLSGSVTAGSSSSLKGSLDGPTSVREIVIASQGAAGESIKVRSLNLKTNPEGCMEIQDEKDELILYKKIDFLELLHTVQDDVVSVEESDDIQSIIVHGSSRWQMFSKENYEGDNIILGHGEYNDFGSFLAERHMEVRSIKRIDELTEHVYRDPKNKENIDCFARSDGENAVFGLVPAPRANNPPSLFYFGDMDNNADLCEQMCRANPACHAWTLFLTSFVVEDLRGQCYGRGNVVNVHVREDNAVSGTFDDCSKEDTFNVYDAESYGGKLKTIVENRYEDLELSNLKSAIVTGRDNWRIMLREPVNNDTLTYQLTPGYYPNFDNLFPDGFVVDALSKVNPHTQYFEGKTTDTGPLAPVAFTQIEEQFPDASKELEKKCENITEAEIAYVIDTSASIGHDNFDSLKNFLIKLTQHMDIAPDKVRVGLATFSELKKSKIIYELNTHETFAAVKSDIEAFPYPPQYATYTHKGIKLGKKILSRSWIRTNLTRLMIIVTDGESTEPAFTKEQAQKARDEGITMVAIGIKDAVYEELLTIAGDKSRVFNVHEFSVLNDIVEMFTETICKSIRGGDIIKNKTEHHSIDVQGDDEAYFTRDDPIFKRYAPPLGVESGVIYDKQMFASSSIHRHEAIKGRLNRAGGWVSAQNTTAGSWIEVDLGVIIPVHGLATQGHSIRKSWVTKYKVAISLDGINFVTLKNGTYDLMFEGNENRIDVKHHCLHRIFAEPINARVVRFIAAEWHNEIAMRVELYGFRASNDPQLLESLKSDVWTKNITGCPCYFDQSRTDCACCESGGCQCPSYARHQCVQCGSPDQCEQLSLRDPMSNVDGWTSSMSGCPCVFQPLRTDCACCQNGGCQCGLQNKNQCVNCANPDQCGMKEWLFGPNTYCIPKTCPASTHSDSDEASVETGQGLAQAEQ